MRNVKEAMRGRLQERKEKELHRLFQERKVASSREMVSGSKAV